MSGKARMNCIKPSFVTLLNVSTFNSVLTSASVTHRGIVSVSTEQWRSFSDGVRLNLCGSGSERSFGVGAA